MTEQPPPPPDQPPPQQYPYGMPPGPPSGPPPGGYDPAWGYGPPGVPYGPPQPQGEETTWAIFSYVGMAVVGFLAPLIIYFVKKNTSPLARFHAAQAMNFQITLLIHLVAVAAIAVPLAITLDTPAIFALLAIPYLELLIGQWVFIILGAIKAGKGQYFRFPVFFCFRMIR